MATFFTYMSNSVLESLKILQLEPGASWPEVTQAYKDLLKIWHPDRYEGDARLKIRAEKSTKELNLAIETLRREYNPLKKKAKQAQVTLRKEAVLPPLEVIENKSYALRDLLQSLLISLIGAFLLVAIEGPPYLLYSSIILVTVGISRAVFSLLLLFSGRAVITINQQGIFTLKSGFFAWSEVAKVEILHQHTGNELRLILSEAFIMRRPYLIRLGLRLLYKLRRCHLIFRWRGFQANPQLIIAAVREISLQAVNVSRAPTKRINILVAVIQYLTVGVLIARALTGFDTGPLELATYLTIFTTCHSYRLVSRALLFGPRLAVTSKKSYKVA